ncbi:MAG: 1-phosphofructokinase [Fimbriimonas ginsengisoli]|uniref:1-phosphofructokinase n=1 Tax=Fimbriimonas ginsengisoli TaxID=1005039 RepID=A0A931PW92_FIMGI|nr:1-phosphofructokinase [Fimbriimonas ginsengisoli]
MILTVTLNPAVDHAIFVNRLRVGDTNEILRAETDAGGKGVNVARIVAALGGEACATGFLGGDPGHFVESVLRKQRVQTSFVRVEEATRMNVSIEDSTGAPPTAFSAPGPLVGPAELATFKEGFVRLCQGASWVAIGGSLPRGLPAGVYHELIAQARAAGAKVAFDADGPLLADGLSGRPDVIKPNAKEAGRLLGREVRTVTQAARAADALRDKLNPGGIAVISLGEQGAVLAYEGGVLIGQSPKVEVRSTVGCGDSMIGAMLWALDSGKPIEEAFRWGLAAGAATARTDGTRIGSGEDIRRLLAQATVQGGP